MSKIAPVAALLLLAGSASAQQQPDQTYVWTHVADGGVQYLSWAVPESDDVGLQFRCASPSNGRVEFSALNVWNGEGPRPRGVTLFSGAAQVVPNGRIEPNEMTGYAFEGELPATSPALLAFARTGALTLRADDSVEVANARAAAERRAIQNFFGLCGRSAR